MSSWRPFPRILLLALLVLGCGGPALADAPKLKAVATFSILGDFVAQVGGDRVVVTTLVQPNADAHGYTPAPSDARTLAEARIVVVNGLGLEGWIDRLIKASGTRAPVVVASAGIKPIEASDDDHGHGHAHHDDPHAWQNVANVKRYVTNIRDALVRVEALPPEAGAHAVFVPRPVRDVRQ